MLSFFLVQCLSEVKINTNIIQSIPHFLNQNTNENNRHLLFAQRQQQVSCR